MGRHKQIVREVLEAGRYKTGLKEDVLHVKKRSGVEGGIVKKDHRFENTRKQNKKLEEHAKAAKALRNALGSFLDELPKSVVKNQMVKFVFQLNEGGANKAFDLNPNAPLDKVLLKPYSLKRNLVIDEFVPAQDLRCPEGATHALFQDGSIKINSATDIICVISERKSVLLNDRKRKFKLKVKGEEGAIYLLKIVFKREGLPVQGGRYNVLSSIKENKK